MQCHSFKAVFRERLERISTSFFRLQKTKPLSMFSVFISFRRASRLSDSVVLISAWVIVVAVVAGASTATSFGFIKKASDSRRICLSIVAEKNKVWRSWGTSLAMRSTSGIKPISSMRSASSMTKYFTSFRRILPRSNRSIRRPGVAIKTSHVLSRAFSWSVNDVPPMMSAMDKPEYFE